MRVQELCVDDALQSLHSGPTGLNDAEAHRRLQEFGPNRVEPPAGTPLWLRFLQSFTHFFALVLWLAAGLAFFAALHDPGGGTAPLGLAILGVIVVNGLFSFGQEYRAERAMAALAQLLPHRVQVVRGGVVREIPVEAVVPGDIVILEAGDDVPADCRLVEAFGVRVNTATVTGESLPQSRTARPDQSDEILRCRNILLAGTSLVAGQARAVVFATGTHTEFGTIARLTHAPRAALSPLQREVVRLSRLIAGLSLALGVACFLAGRVLGLSFWQNFLFAIGVIVANVPEGLLPTLTLALAIGSQRMARRNALVRHLPAVETLGSATVICTDKTGTLTENRMAVVRLFLSGRVRDTLDAPAKGHRSFFEALANCQTLKVSGHGAGSHAFLGDPTEVALVKFAAAYPEGCQRFPRVDEVPFDSDRRRLSTLHRTPRGLVLYTKGALEALLPLCGYVHTDGQINPLNAEVRRSFLTAQDGLAGAGLRVLAVAFRDVAEDYDADHLEEGLTLVGLVALEDPPRPEVPEAVARCQSAGIRVIMITGDHPQTARAIAGQIGLADRDTVVISGTQLRRMTRSQLQFALDRPGVHFARVGAEQKLQIVQALQAKGHTVAVTGDGVNDAPALHEADIGVAMGRCGTDVARAAADVVLLDDNFATIVAAVEEGRAVYANIRKFLTYILTSNVPELVPFLAFVLFRVPLALTIVQILAVDLGTDMLPALALGAEPPEPDVLRRPPRDKRRRLVDWPLLARSYLFLGLWQAAGAMTVFFLVLGAGGWSYPRPLDADDPLYRESTAACLSAIVALQVVNLFLCRSERGSLFVSRLRPNRWLVAGVATECVAILLIVYTAAGNRLFGTAPVPLWAWLAVVPFAILMIAAEELRKLVARRIHEAKP